MTRLRILAVGVLALMLGFGRGRAVIKRWASGLESASACPRGRRRLCWGYGEPAPADRAGGLRPQAGRLGRFWRPIVLAGVVVGLLVGPSTALASSGWSAPTLVDGPAFSATGVSCPSASFCAAVASNGRAMTFNGSSWSAPANIDTYPLASVSCASASFCVAVDGYTDRLQNHSGRAFTFNGSSWSAPVSIDATSSLESVSCPSASFCVAVDSGGNALTFHGGSWSAPAHIAGVNDFYSVSCPSASFCVATTGGSSTGTSAVTFNGSSWSVPVNITYGSHVSVSCAVASFCAAVDLSGNAVTFNGSSWSVPTSIARPLSSVLCPLASFCVGVDQPAAC